MPTEFFIDRKFRLPRIWSNKELRRFAHFFEGSVINVSAWKDKDKEGGFYRDYFTAASSYDISNYRSEARGLQGLPNEHYIDLTKSLPEIHYRRYDCVFNHTTLEHIYDVDTAFMNLCEMSRDAVVVVVPFLQQMHASYGDFWRFTPLSLAEMFRKNSLQPVYTSYNNHFMASVYVFMIAVRDPARWKNIYELQSDVPISAISKWPDPFEHFVGCNAIPSFKSGLLTSIKNLIRR